MGPFYEIYGLSENRDKETIERFLEHFTFRNLIEDRKGQEISVHSNVKYGVEEFFKPVKTLSQVIQFGINHPNIGFAFYIGNGKNLKPGIGDVLLKFTFDSKLIFGVGIEEKVVLKDGSVVSNFPFAVEVKEQLIELTGAYKTSIQFEYPPSDDEAEFDEDMEMWKDLTNGKIS